MEALDPQGRADVLDILEKQTASQRLLRYVRLCGERQWGAHHARYIDGVLRAHEREREELDDIPF